MIDKESIRRYEFVDLLKAIAIFFVTIYHYNNIKINFFETQDNIIYFNYFIRSIFSTGVPLFFLVNGLLILNKDLVLKQHIKKILNFIKILILWNIITLIFLMIINNETIPINKLTYYLYNFKDDWTSHLWFLESLIIIYIFFPLIKSTYETSIENLYYFLAIIFLITFGSRLLSNIINVLKFFLTNDFSTKDIDIFNFFSNFKCIYGYSFVYFITGGILTKYNYIFQKRKIILISIVLIPISMLLLTLYGIIMSINNYRLYDTVWSGYNTIPTLCMVISIYILSLQYKGYNNKLFHIINYIGKNSLGIYLVHRIWGSLFIKYFKEIPYSDNIITNFIFAALVILISLLSVTLINKNYILKKILFV